MKYRIFGKDGVNEFEHSKLVEWKILKEKPRLHGLLDHDTYKGNPPVVLKTLGKTRKSLKES